MDKVIDALQTYKNLLSSAESDYDNIHGFRESSIRECELWHENLIKIIGEHSVVSSGTLIMSDNTININNPYNIMSNLLFDLSKQLDYNYIPVLSYQLTNDKLNVSITDNWRWEPIEWKFVLTEK